MRTATCPRCSSRVLVGVDDIGLDVALDPTPLDQRGEALAVLDGRKTYTVDKPGRRGPRELWRRRAPHIGHPMHGSTVHAAHRCHQPIPAGWTPPPAVRSTAHQEDPLW